MSETDFAATRERKFKDKKSRVMRDGRESLRGKDWTYRKAELAERSGGRCEYESCPAGPSDAPMDRCIENAIIPAHIIPRHPLRDDRLKNLMHFCFAHDRLTEKQNWRRTRFGEKVLQEAS